jgi:hypothetical protein
MLPVEEKVMEIARLIPEYYIWSVSLIKGTSIKKKKR